MPEDLLEYAEMRAGEYLRVVATYSEGSFELRYVRDDIRERYAEATIRMAVDELAQSESVPETLQDSFSPQYASLRLFPEVCLVHLGGDERGAIISLDPQAAANLVEFVEDCASRWEPSSA